MKKLDFRTLVMLLCVASMTVFSSCDDKGNEPEGPQGGQTEQGDSSENNGEDDTPVSSTQGIGVFSVSDDMQVSFSPGNLQYTRSTDTWQFASSQWECIGTDNLIGGNVSSDLTYGDSKSGGTALADKIDLFGWGTGANPTNSSEDDSDYSTFVDWGSNQIGNDAPNTWRTLTDDEWDYLLYSRTNASSLGGVAEVNGVNGLILLPDGWSCPDGVTFKSGVHSEFGAVYYAAYQTFTASAWQKMEKAGAVFLPAAGFRNFSSNVNYVGMFGFYWSSTFGGSDSAWFFNLGSSGVVVGNDARFGGISVRLVQNL